MAAGQGRGEWCVIEPGSLATKQLVKVVRSGYLTEIYNKGKMALRHTQRQWLRAIHYVPMCSVH